MCTPDDYLCDQLAAWPAEICDTVVRLAGEKRRPPMTPIDLTHFLAKAGVPTFAQRLQTKLADQDQS